MSNREEILKVLQEVVDAAVNNPALLDHHKLKKPEVSTDMKSLFKCGKPLRHTPEKSESKPTDDWNTILKPIEKDDKEKCDAWKGEIDNILIFAALFSAIVTAFLIESYQLLKPDDAQNLTVNEVVNANVEEGTIPYSSITINICWFLSLVLSLSTALIGLICLQWLREHLSYPEYLTPEQTFALLNMKTEMLQKWHVGPIISSLPVIMQIALLFFFAGLGQFLISLQEDRVTIPVLVFITIISLFPVITLVLPALQIYAIQKETRMKNQIPTPCPYRSPQAHLFYSASTFIMEKICKLHATAFGCLTGAYTRSIQTTIAFTQRTFSFAIIQVLAMIFWAFGIGVPGMLVIFVFESPFRIISFIHALLQMVYNKWIQTSEGSQEDGIHYTHAFQRFQSAARHEKATWWAFDLGWVSIRRDYSFRLQATRHWKHVKEQPEEQKKQIPESSLEPKPSNAVQKETEYFQKAWETQDVTQIWQRDWCYGPPYDQIQGLLHLSHQYQYDDSSDQSMMEASYRCFKQCLDIHRAKSAHSSKGVLDDGIRDKLKSPWEILFFKALGEMLRIKDFSFISDAFSNPCHALKASPANIAIYDEALFCFLAEMNLKKTSFSVRIQETWAELYFRLVDFSQHHKLQDYYVSVHPLHFVKHSGYLSSIAERFSYAEQKGVSSQQFFTSLEDKFAPDIIEIQQQDIRTHAEVLDNFIKNFELNTPPDENKIVFSLLMAITVPL